MREFNAKNPLIEQRADPWIYKHTDGYYYFIASVPSLIESSFVVLNPFRD